MLGHLQISAAQAGHRQLPSEHKRKQVVCNGGLMFFFPLWLLQICIHNAIACGKAVVLHTNCCTQVIKKKKNKNLSVDVLHLQATVCPQLKKREAESQLKAS